MRQEPLDTHPHAYTPAIWAARLYSNIASPPALFAAFGFLMAWEDQASFSSLAWAAVYGLFASLLPVLYVVYLYKSGQVRDLHVSNPAERRIPYLVGLAGAAFSFALVNAWGGSPLLSNLILSHVVLMASLALINFRWLISAHLASVTALTLMTAYTFGLSSGLILLPFVPLTFYVRRYLKRHTSGELTSGVLLGSAIVLFLAAAGLYA